MPSLARCLGVVGIIALVLFFDWRSARRSSVARYPVAIPLDPLALGSGVEIDGDEDDEIDLDDELGLELEGADGHQLMPAHDEVAVMHNEIGELIDRQPDAVAQVLRGLIAARRGGCPIRPPSPAAGPPPTRDRDT